MSELALKLKQNNNQQACNTKFLELLHSSNRIEATKDKLIVPSVPLNDFKNVALPSISKEKIMLKSRAKSQYRFSLPKHKSNDKQSGFLKNNEKMALFSNAAREKILNGLDMGNTTRKGSHHSSNVNRKSAKAFRSPEFVTPPFKNQIISIDTTVNHSNSKPKLHITKLSNHAMTIQIKQQSKLPRRDIMLNVQYGQIQENVAYQNFMKLPLETHEITHKQIITKLNVWLKKFSIRKGTISTADLPNIMIRKSIANHLILSQFTNYKQMYDQYVNIMPGLKYYNHSQPQIGRNLAALKVTSLFQMNFDRKYAKKLRSLMKKVKIIQRQWKACIMYRRTREKILQATYSRIQQAKELTAQLMRNWEIDRSSPKIQIHICSLCIEQFKRFTIENLQQRENTQLTRIFRAMDPDTRIIYITPVQLGLQVIRYYQRIFSINASSQAFSRITFISLEEEYHRFQTISEQFQYLSSATMLRYSTRTLKKIRNSIEIERRSMGSRSSCYIVPSYPSNQYIAISASLNIPLFSSAIQSLNKLYSTKSGFRQLLRPVISQPGNKSVLKLLRAVQDLYSEKEIINSLAILIHKHKSVKKWYFKIDDEIESRGLAVFDISTIQFLRELNRQNDCTSQQIETNITEKSIIRLIADELQSKLKHRLKIHRKDIYSNYEQYLTHFITRGGVIEASPCSKTANHSISFLIEPNGDFSLLNTYSRLYSSSSGTFCGIKCPSNLDASEVDSQVIVRSLYRILWGKHRMFGYYTVDLLYQAANHQIYVIGLDCFLNEKSCSIFIPQLTCSSRYVKQANCLQKSIYQTTETAKLENESSLDREWEGLNELQSVCKMQQLHYLYSPMLIIKQLPSVSAFFRKCKFSNISFDLQRKTGTIILLMGPIESGCIGFMTVSESVDSMLTQVQKLVDFLSKDYQHKENRGIRELRGVLVSWIRGQKKSIDQLKNRDNLDLNLIF